MPFYPNECNLRNITLPLYLYIDSLGIEYDFSTAPCITDLRSQRLELPRDLHKTKITDARLSYHFRKYKILPNRPTPCHHLFQFHIYLTTFINIRLTHGSRTTVANTRFHKKGQAYQKSCQKMSFGFPIKSHPIKKKSLYTHWHPNKLPPILLKRVSWPNTKKCVGDRGPYSQTPFIGSARINGLLDNTLICV